MGEARIKCMIRLRPPDHKDSQCGDMVILHPEDEQRITIMNPYSRGSCDEVSYEFDKLFGMGAT